MSYNYKSQNFAVGSGLKAAASLNNATAPSCYVTTGGTGTAMTGVGHYIVKPGGDPSKAGLKVEDIAKETNFFGALSTRKTMDDFLNVKGPRLGDAGRVFISGTDTTTNFVVPPPPKAPASPMVSRPHLFGKPISRFSKADGLVKRDRQAANKVDSEANETENEDSYSDDDDFEEEEEEEEEDEETIRARKEIEEKAKAKLLEEAFAYVANIKSGKRQGSGLSSANTNSKRKNKKKKKQQQQLGWNNKSQIAIREQQRRNKQSLYGSNNKNGSKRGSQGRRRKQKKASNRAFLEQEQNRYEYRNQTKNLYENMKSRQSGNTSVTMRDLRKRPQIVLAQQCASGGSEAKGNDIRKESAENSDESIMANRRRLKNQNMPSAPNETANEESSNSAIMSQWKSKPSTTKNIDKPILGDSSSRHVNSRKERVSGKKNGGKNTGTESVIRTKSRKLSAEEIEHLTKNFEEGLELKKLQAELTKAEEEEKAIQNENEKKTLDFMAQIRSELNLGTS